MNRNIVNILLLLLTILFFNSCKKDSDKLDSALFGTWNVTKVQGQQYNNGVAGLMLMDDNPTGFVRFNSDGTGTQNYTFTIFNTTYPNVSDFVWESSNKEIIIKRFNQSDLIWRRITDEPNKQEATYSIFVTPTQYWDYTLTLEK